jgi:predicted dehydrogenase
MKKQNRRQFIRQSALAGAGLTLFHISGTRASGRILSANDRIRIGVVGIHGRGGSHIKEYAGMKNVEVAYLVDIDTKQFDPRKKFLEDKTGKAPTCVQDVRRALEDKDLDAISIATCNHTHSLYTVWACQAGKDVYVEKPISHNVWEGRKCVEAARKHGCMVQHGTQQRSSQGRANEIVALQSGKYGKLLVSKGYCCKPRWTIGFKPFEDPPPNINFDIWLGPAPLQPYHANLVHYNWHWFWDFGCGDIGNQGVHEIDVARWAIKGATLPHKVWSLGGRLGYKDQGQTPNMLLSVYEFDDALLLFETRGLVGKHKDYPAKITNEFYTTEGMIAGGKFHPKNGGPAEPVTGGEPEKVTPGGPFGSFIHAMRTRKVEDLNADVEVAHYSAALCHLGNLSYKLGQPRPFSQGRPAQLGDNEQVQKSFAKIEGNLEAVGVDLKTTDYELGPVLDFNPAKERFVSNEAANKLLTRNYRKPYVVPEKV